MKLGMCEGSQPDHICLNYNIGLTLTYFTARSYFVNMKVKTVDFSGTIAASDLKV